MRNYSEFSARNLLRAPTVLGAPASGMVVLLFVVLSLSLLLGEVRYGQAYALSVALVGYLVLRAFQASAKPGWAEPMVYFFERLSATFKHREAELVIFRSPLPLASPDTYMEWDHVSVKEELSDQIQSLNADKRRTILFSLTSSGALCEDVSVTTHGIGDHRGIRALNLAGYPQSSFAYSLTSLPVHTDPLWLARILAKLPTPVQVIVSVKGLDTREVRRRIEYSRKLNSSADSALQAVDSEVTFEEASQVLEGISRGDEKMVEGAVLILSPIPLDLDPDLFTRERFIRLAVESTLGLRERFFRGHWMRVQTACDLIPQALDPIDAELPALLRTLRGLPLYFTPRDSRLEAPHWLVSGATGSGKSFFTALILKRLLESGEKFSVLFIDQHRGFKRFVESQGGYFYEPETLARLEVQLTLAHFDLIEAGMMTGIEVSDFAEGDKRAAIELILGAVENCLKCGKLEHTLYVVMDEAWSLMRLAPDSIQRTFREYRKLGGAVIAITQSLGDLLTTDHGQSIFQNAPVRVLLRQGEDISRYQGILGLNATETDRVHRLRQVRGIYSECLIRTPFSSCVGRLYPTKDEHELLRTDPFSNHKHQHKPNPEALT